MPSQIEGEQGRSRFIYVLNRGESKQDSVIVTNHAGETKTIAIEALDAITTSDGSYSVVDSVEKNQDVGNWIQLEATTIVLPAGASREVGFTITVPETAGVGEHSGGIAVYARDAASKSGITLKTRVATRMYITVPGKIERNIIFEEVTHKIEDNQLIFNIRAKNDSNVKLEPALDITLSALLGSRTQQEDENGVFLPGWDMEITKIWDKPAPKFGFYRVKVVLHTWTMEQTLPDGTTSTIPNLDFTYKFSFWVGGGYLLWTLIILMLLWIIYRTFVYFGDKSKYILEVETYTVKKGDTIMHISERTGIFPRVLVKLNQLKWPYVINAGDKLLIPRGRMSAGKLHQKKISNPMPSFWRYLISAKMSIYHPFPDKSDK